MPTDKCLNNVLWKNSDYTMNNILTIENAFIQFID